VLVVRLLEAGTALGLMPPLSWLVVAERHPRAVVAVVVRLLGIVGRR